MNPAKKSSNHSKKFFEHEIIETKARKYSLTGKDPKAAKEEEPEPEVKKFYFLWSLERALLPRPAAYKAAALLG